jgi:hypothetical protein
LHQHHRRRSINSVIRVAPAPDPNTFAQTGNVCAKDGDCCDTKAKCINAICSEAPSP